MNCREAREGLWPPERPRLVGDAVAEAQLHTRSCPECARFFAQDRRLLDAYASLRRIRAPRDLRARVLDALASERGVPSAPGPAGRLRRPLLRTLSAGIAVGVLAGLALSHGWGDQVRQPPAGSAFLDDYLRRAVAQDRIETADAGEIARFLERELGIPLWPIAARGVRPSRAEICLLDGRRGAMIEYLVDGRRVAHYLLPRSGVRARPPALRTGRGPGALPMVTWANPSVEQALVGDVGAERLLGVAREGARR